MMTFAEQHLEQWASFAELSTKHGKIVPQRPTIKVKLFLLTCFSFWTERVCWSVIVVEKRKWPQARVHCKIVYSCTQRHIEKADNIAAWIVIFLYMFFFFSSAPEITGGRDSLLCGKCTNRTWTPGCNVHPGNHEQCYEVLQGGGVYKPWIP